ncbi:MAG TPA: helix-turn-helix domain-containing protein [Candidatus Omnitrophota bacterium]|nr:helix-turn-helix domain-containing protein [Candidatus Omnitrophota bacterium]
MTQTTAETGKTRRKASRGRTPSGKPNPIDIHVGGRVRLRRTLLGITQEKLAESLGLTFQQVQKYERGANRVGASRLFDLSRVLDVPVSFFFEEMSEDVQKNSPGLIGNSADPESAVANYKGDPVMKRETLELVRAYYRIKDPDVRKRVCDLANALGEIVGASRG